MKHMIETDDFENRLKPEERRTIKDVITAVLAEEKISYACSVSVSVVSEEEIRSVNLEQRGVDRATDVLSFPALEFDDSYHLAQPIGPADMDPETGTVYLGDIVICNDVLERQALEYGHSKKRELGYLTTHSMYHLLGYDHVTEELKRDMRQKEEVLLRKLGISREES